MSYANVKYGNDPAGDQKLGCKAIRLIFLFTIPVFVLEKHLTLAMQEDMPRLVEEAEPELVIGLVAR